MKHLPKYWVHTFESITLPLFAVFTVIGFYQLAWFVYGILLSGLVLCTGYMFAGAYLFAYPERKRYAIYSVFRRIYVS